MLSRLELVTKLLTYQRGTLIPRRKEKMSENNETHQCSNCQKFSDCRIFGEVYHCIDCLKLVCESYQQSFLNAHIQVEELQRHLTDWMTMYNELQQSTTKNFLSDIDTQETKWQADLKRGPRKPRAVSKKIKP